ncbi:DUF6541 family protein [Lysobacter korlensis]|uniref:DUF6541 family protein n=1 Tax=Lysobacter korlensis TaxID=553636 RepID=A0ABV6S1P1_9GAMM
MTDLLSWAAILPAILLLLAPGGLIAYSLGLRGLILVATAGPITLAGAGVLGVILGELGVPFSVWGVLAAALLAAALVLLTRRLLRQRRPVRLLADAGGRTPWQVWLAVAVSGLAIAVGAIVAVGTADSVSQSYDAVFHLNAAAFVLQEGDASSFHLYRLSNPGDDLEFYPAAWHILTAMIAQVTGAGIPAAMNAAWVAVSVGVWVPGAVVLTDTLAGRAPNRRLLLAGAAILSSAFSAFPLLLLEWGTLYPTGLAYAQLPVGLALLVLAVLSPRGREPLRDPDPVRLRPWVLLTLWVAAAAFAHPRSLPTFAVFVAPLVVYLLIRWARRGWLEGRRRRVALVLGGVTAGTLLAAVAALVVVFRFYRVGARPIADRLNGGPATARQGFFESLLQGLTHSVVIGPPEGPLAPLLLLAALTLGGLWLAVRRPQYRWIVVAYVGLVLLYAFAAGSNSDLAKVLTGLWYKDKYRLMSALPILAVPLAAAGLTAGVAVLRSWLGRRRVPWARTSALGAAALVVVAGTSWFSASQSGVRASITTMFSVPEVTDREILSADDRELLRQLPEHVPDGERVAGNPWDGTSLAWAIGDREPLFPHLTGNWDPDRRIVAERLDRAAEDPAVCAALDRLDTHYLVHSEDLLSGGDPQAEYFAPMTAAADAPGFEAVARSGTSVLYRITACD